MKIKIKKDTVNTNPEAWVCAQGMLRIKTVGGYIRVGKNNITAFDNLIEPGHRHIPFTGKVTLDFSS